VPVARWASTTRSVAPAGSIGASAAANPGSCSTETTRRQRRASHAVLAPDPYSNAFTPPSRSASQRSTASIAPNVHHGRSSRIRSAAS
jgi:hypothetical protein